jgi:hypothetical protein
MSRNESLSLDEFVTAPRKQPARPMPDVEPSDIAGRSSLDGQSASAIEPAQSGNAESPFPSEEARKALRQVKRERMKGASHFVNVSLDRETKRRLKLASFNWEMSMQAIMEKAIRKYLDENGL